MNKARQKGRYFHGIVNPTTNSDGSVAWRYVGTEANSKARRSAEGWAKKVVSLALGERINPITPRERRHI